MDNLNYHHLYYFWVVAREGTIAQAGERLNLAQPTISTQLKKLEESLGERLFRKSGRRQELTETGHRVFRYADEIFAIGREMVEAIKGLPTGKPARFAVGVPDSLPRPLVYRLLKPVFQLSERVQLVCQGGSGISLLADLAVHRLDVVLSDTPLEPSTGVKAFSHELGECGLSFFGSEALVDRYRLSFPKTLNDAPLLLPTIQHSLRRAFDTWCGTQRLSPRVIAEFDDTAVMTEFGRAGLGVFPAPSAIEAEVQTQYRVRVVGRVPELFQRYYAISTERRVKHPAVLAMLESARQDLLSPLTSAASADH